ncbi:MAG: BrnT family toxin [Candidatus Methylumidiphilus sp.]
MFYEWDEAKREANFAKHGLDLADGDMVYESPLKLELETDRQGEIRVQAIAYVFDRLAVLSLAYTGRGNIIRFISLRYASRNERGAYHEWLENREND